MLNPAYFRDKAVDCRARAQTAGDPVIHQELLSLAERYERLAAEIEKFLGGPPLPSWAAP